MRFSVQDFGGIKNNEFGKLGLWYVLALSSIATIIIIGQILIQNHLHNQLNDSRVVNLAGRQRMLSQKIVKLCLQLNQSFDSANTLRSELEETVLLWARSHQGLQTGDESMKLPGHNSAVVDSMFLAIQPHFDAIVDHVGQLVEGTMPETVDSLKTSAAIREILRSEKPFLEGMDQIVNQYDLEARQKVSKLSKMEYALLAISLLVILVEILFIFRPTARQVSNTVSRLVASEKNATKMAKEISAIYKSLEKSYEQIARVNEPDEIPRVWAKADKGGNVTFISDVFRKLSGIIEEENMCIADLFPGSGLNDDFMDELVEVISEQENWSGQIMVKSDQKQVWVEIFICPILSGEKVREVLVLGTDITHRKQAENDMLKKNKNEIEKRINEQKYRSVLILEGQEEERKRLAMDIHDGIGQMLSSLKFQMEGLKIESDDENLGKIQEIKNLVNDTIKEVRRVTFNLKPTVLGDYGIAAGFKLFVKEIKKYSHVQISFANPGNINDRFPQRIENNVFRIAQEAINNAIKYAHASSIELRLHKDGEDLVVQVVDDGVGFDTRRLKEAGIDSGSGLFNMYERTEYINGKLEIDSMPGEGTKIELRIPIGQTINN